MNHWKPSLNLPAARLWALAAAAAGTLTTQVAQANPYASCLTNNNGTIQFYLNEGGATVTVVYDDGTTNSSFNGVTSGTNQSTGLKSFPLSGHLGYQIICSKNGNGTPAQISSDTSPFSTWGTPRGVDVNKNPKMANRFGRVFIGNAGTSATRQWGLYCLTPDLSTNALGHGTNAEMSNVWAPAKAAGSTSGPYRITVAPDDSIYVTDYSTAGATVWQFGPGINEISNLVLYPVGENQGIAAGTHGDPIGVFVTGSIATGDLTVYTADPGMGAPSTAQLGAGYSGTAPGDYNNIFRYDIGAGPLPWSHAPNFAVSLGLNGFEDSQIVDMTMGLDGKLFGMIRRANFTPPNIQVFDQNGNGLYNSLHPAGPSDIFENGYAGVRISPDGLYMATMTINNAILIVSLTNGIPDESSLVTIANTPTTGNARGIAWDAADNLYACSSGQGLLRSFSLGITATTVTTNDYTGTNGGFKLLLPPTQASLAVTQPLASQNYVNNTPAGTPIPGVFTINLNTNFLVSPVTVSFTVSGTASYPSNYTMNIGKDANGVTISSNSVTFPAGDYGGSGNWSTSIQIIPTAKPLVGPTLTVTFRLSGGLNYTAGTPLTGTVAIANTGPQVLVLSAATTGTSMRRGVANDYAEFVITRLGDTNGPGNSASSITPASYTLTNATYGGTASYPVDFTALVQRTDPAGNGVVQLPVTGNPGLVIYPGDVTITGMIGNPVAHANLAQPPVTATIALNLTNATTGTNLTSSEGLAYAVTTSAVTLTEIDNTIGPEVVIWSNPLTNATDSTNWTLVFAATNLASTTVPPLVIPNYTNGTPTLPNVSPESFEVTFGNPVANDSVPLSEAMAANGWANALRMTVNKDAGSPAQAGVNLYPQGMNFQGNYALRFSMYLSLYATAVNNPFAGTYAREFAAFGINHYGTNCNWRLAAPIPAGSGCSTTNSDGVWFAIDAASGSLTPADFDAFTPARTPNSGVTADLVSNAGNTQAGVFKSPPFVSMGNSGGEPVDQWVDVSVQVTSQTNVSLLMNGSPVLSSFAITNGGNYTNGTVMLGYLDPVNDVSDSSAFVYYSNLRVVELSPYILTQPLSLIATQGANVTLTAPTAFASAPMTNVWYTGLTGPLVPVSTNVAAATNMPGTLSLVNVQTGTNFFPVFSDIAGSVTGVVSVLEVIQGPTNLAAKAGTTVQFAVTPTGQAAPTSYQWKFGTTTLANSSHYAGVTTSVLTITNVQSADIGVYSVVVVNANGTVTPSATLTLGPSGVTVTPASRTNLWGSTATFTVTAGGTPPFTYQWKKAGVNLTDGGNVSGSTNTTLTLSPVTTADAASYTVGVTNGIAGVVSGAGTLKVIVPAPAFSTVTLTPDGSEAVLAFGSTNVYDTTNAFILQSSAVVQGPYTNTPATVSSNGTFQILVPQAGGNMFYRLLHVP